MPCVRTNTSGSIPLFLVSGWCLLQLISFPYIYIFMSCCLCPGIDAVLFILFSLDDLPEED